MLELYTNQQIVWRHVVSVNEYNEPTYSTAAMIRGRKQDQVKYVRKPNGVEVISTSQVITKTAVTPGDLLDGRTVVAIENSRDLSGKILFKVVFLE